MISKENIRIIPVMILVTFMAFSVRLVDFAAGVSSLSGSAFAKSEDPAEVAETAAQNTPEPDQTQLAMSDPPESEAAAQEAEQEAAPAPAAPPKIPEDDGPSIDWRDASDAPYSAESVKMEVFEDLTARREELDKKERDLQTREALLRAAEQEIERKYQEMTTLRAELENLLDRQTEEEKARIASLVKIYENMKPKEAARIFDTLDLDVLMSVMSKMSERKLSPILAAMNPERARTITILLAEEKTLPELPDNN